jgi:UDP-2,3-diacylglucosamine pyrophosphatase LpxH
MRFQLSPAALLRAVALLKLGADGSEPDDDHFPWSCRFIAVSDLHVLTPAFQAEPFLRFLKSIYSDTICIDGDFVDFMMAFYHRYFPQSHMDVFFKLMRKARKGVDVVIIPGNHDWRLRKTAKEALEDGEIFRLGDNIVLVPQHLHTTKLGEQVLLLHGDEFEGKLSWFKDKVGNHGHDVITWLDRNVNRVTKVLGLGEWSIAEWFKHFFDRPIRRYSSEYITPEVATATSRDYEAGVIAFGHIHFPMDLMIAGVRVINLGSWVDRSQCTALIEDMDGVLGLVRWHDDKLFNFATGEEIPHGPIRFTAATTSEASV